jgi:hypothetical protein
LSFATECAPAEWPGAKVVESTVTETDAVDAVGVGAGCCVGAGALTGKVASPVTDSTVARIVALPGATALTVPLIETVAMLVFNDDHETVRPLRTLPVASRTIALAPIV